MAVEPRSPLDLPAYKAALDQAALMPSDEYALEREAIAVRFKVSVTLIDKAIKERKTGKSKPKPNGHANGNGHAAHFHTDHGWRDGLILSSKGNPLPLLANALTAFRGAPEWAGKLSYDDFHRDVCAASAPWQSAKEPFVWTDNSDVLAAEWLQHQDMHVKPEVAGQAAEAVARERSFHPVRDYLDGCRWDGVGRLDSWATRYLGVASTAYTKAVSARWLMSAVARIYEPGCKADCCLILEGPQGLLKSTALKTMGGAWFTDEIADLGSKDAALQLAGAWIIELAELDSLSRSEVGRIKAFMSRDTDRFRPPYGRHVIRAKRECIFAGTANMNDYLRDETGGRRFWPLACTSVDIPGLAEARDQLWAEARERYQLGEKWWLDTAKLIISATEEQAERYQGDPWLETIRDYIATKDDVSVNEILAFCINKPLAECGQADQNQVSRCLRSLGWERYRKKENTKLSWRYKRRPSASTEAVNGTEDDAVVQS